MNESEKKLSERKESYIVMKLHDYQQVNKVTIKNKYPTPHIDETNWGESGIF